MRINFIFLLIATMSAYKPVFFMHGLGANSGAGAYIQSWLPPGQIFVSIPLYNDNPASWTNLPTQVQQITAWMEQYINTHSGFENGYHLLCHSQGALICRCIAESWDNHKIDTLISLAGPQLGVYGDSFFKFFKIPGLENLTKDIAWFVLYNPVSQAAFSVAQLWYDPWHQQNYDRQNTLLPGFNGEKGINPRYKENFLRLKKAAFFVGDPGPGSTTEGGIDPWFSGVFMFYDTNYNIIPTKNTYEYRADTFGLQTMDQRGDLLLTIVQGVSHGAWVANHDIFVNYLQPLLCSSELTLKFNSTNQDAYLKRKHFHLNETQPF